MGTVLIQILTVGELLEGKGVSYPTTAQRMNVTFKKAPRPEREQLELL